MHMFFSSYIAHHINPRVICRIRFVLFSVNILWTPIVVPDPWIETLDLYALSLRIKSSHNNQQYIYLIKIEQVNPDYHSHNLYAFLFIYKFC